ncbi:SAG family member [Eimeria maxima]|uniref:SAG family member n=1 Tax=Eimeria maxima TaxID=5804 RepID=U6M1Q4_EIMMA|nr:SAG family member [Eimeria maxima]CDJ57951.1 SAG family member [Eimeria maxima]
MAALCLLTVLSAALVVVSRENVGVSATITTKYKVTLGNDAVCLPDINKARQKAGLNDLVQAKQGGTTTRLPQAGEEITSDYDNWEQSKKTASDPTAFKSGTYAYQVVDPHSVNCDTVVDKWKDAYTNFDGVPPAYKDNKTLYSNPNNVSLVAMYNPSDNASADCRVVTCTKTVTDDATEDPTKITEGSALICLTAPAALDKTRATGPFTKDQWGRIVEAIEGSAPSVVPSVLGLVTALLGVMVAV